MPRFYGIRWLSLLCGLLALAPGSAQEAKRIENVVYGRKFGMALTMDVLKPAKPNGIGVLFMMSGGWASDPGFYSPQFLNPEWFTAFTQRGQTVFLVAHGSQPKYALNEIIPDIQRAARFIRARAADYGVHPFRLGISGLSSGGHLSLMLGATGAPGNPDAKDPIERASSQVQAVACFFPPTDLVDYGKAGRTFLEFDNVRAFWHVLGVQGKPREEQVMVLRGFSPYHQATKAMPPTLIIQGDNDPLVPHEQAERFLAKLKELGVPHRLDLRKGAAHGWPEMGKDFSLLAEWFEKYLPEKTEGK